jgi:hypothetical protein
VSALEHELDIDEYPTRIVAWPNRTPARSRRKPGG